MALLTPPVWLENSADHNAVDYRAMLASLVPSSGVGDSSALEVTEKSGTADMSVDVAAGGAFIASTRGAGQGTYHAYNDGTVNVALSASDPTNPRIDRIVVQVRDEAQDPALTQNDVRLLVIEGTPGASPSAPTVTIDDYYELAQVTVPAAATAITNADIADSRTLAGRPSGARSGSGYSTADLTVASAYVVASSITLPAGRWDISASGRFEWSMAASGATLRAQLYDGAAGQEIRHRTARSEGSTPFALGDIIELGSTTTVSVRVTTDDAAGTQFASAVRLIARPA